MSEDRESPFGTQGDRESPFGTQKTGESYVPTAEGGADPHVGLLAKLRAEAARWNALTPEERAREDAETRAELTKLFQELVSQGVILSPWDSLTPEERAKLAAKARAIRGSAQEVPVCSEAAPQPAAVPPTTGGA